MVVINNNGNGDKQKNYMQEGMCFGMLAGSIGMSICTIFGQLVFGSICISAGMLIGMMIGLCIKKEK